MHLPRFAHLSPGSIQEAIDLLNKYPRCAVMAGGTDLLPRMKYRLTAPETVISLKHVRSKPPMVTPQGYLVLDALMTLNTIGRSPLIRERVPILAEAVQVVASNEIRNMGTIGGNLCQQTRCLYYNQRHRFQFVAPCYKRGGDSCYFIPKGKKCWAVFMSDTAPALISLGAEIRIMGPEGIREMPLEELYTGDARRPLALDPNEILFEVSIPPWSSGRHGEAFFKLSLRGGLEFAALSAAAVIEEKEDKKARYRARLTVGGVSARPKRARKGEAILAEGEFCEDLFSEVAGSVAKEIDPVPHHGYSRAYLAEALRVSTRAVLTRASTQLCKDQ